MLTRSRRALKYFLGCAIPKNDNPPVIEEIDLVEVSSVREIELAHLPVGQIHAAGHNRNHARANLESEVAIDLAAHRPYQRHFDANGFHIFKLVLDGFSCALAASLHAGLSRPHDNDVVAHVQKSVQDASAEPLPVREQQHYRHQAPADAQHGER